MSKISTITHVGGSLARQAEIRSYPSPALLPRTGARARDEKLIEQRVMIVHDNKISRGALNSVMSYYVSRFYQEAGHHDIRPERLLASMAGIIGNCTDFSAIQPWTGMVNAYESAGIKLEVRYITWRNMQVILNQDERLHEFLDRWGTDQRYMLGETRLPFILACVLLVSMSKNLTEVNWKTWFMNRVASFSGTVGDRYTPQNFSETQLPALSQLNGLHTIVTANHMVRRELYREIVSISLQPKNAITSALAEVHHLMKGLEMNHLMLIDKYILEEYPEFLSTTMLRGFKPRWGAAMAYLSGESPEDRLYVKLLKDKDESALINRRIFDAAHTVAVTIAKFTNSTFDNFYISRDPRQLRIQRIVFEYLEIRQRLGGLAAGGQDFEAMVPEEKTEFLKRIMARIESNESDESTEIPAFTGTQYPILEGLGSTSSVVLDGLSLRHSRHHRTDPGSHRFWSRTPFTL